MKTLTPLQKATVQMSVGIAVLTAVTEVIYLILTLAVPSLSYNWKFTVGNVFMACIMALNFYLMARGIYHAVDMGDEEYAKRQIRLSHTVRSLLLILALVSCFLFGYGLEPNGVYRYEPGIAACITVTYPQLTVFALRMFGKIGTDEPLSADEGTPDAGGTDSVGGGIAPRSTVPPDASKAGGDDHPDAAQRGAALPPVAEDGGEEA